MFWIVCVILLVTGVIISSMAVFFNSLTYRIVMLFILLFLDIYLFPMILHNLGIRHQINRLNAYMLIPSIISLGYYFLMAHFFEK